MKKILIGSVAVIGVVAVAGAVAVHYLLDGETIAQELQKEAKTRFNRDLTFAGPIDIQLFPKIAVQLPATTLTYAGSDQAQMTLNSASVGVMVLPLLKGEVKLDAIKVDGLKGKLNIARLKAALDKKQTAAQVPSEKVNSEKTSSGLSFIKDFSVHGIDLFDSALTLYGLPDKKVYALEKVSLSTGAIGLQGETSIRIAADFSEKTENTQGHVGIDSHLIYNLKTLDVSLEKFSGRLLFNRQDEQTQFQLSAPKIGYLNGDVTTESVDVVIAAPNSTEVKASMKLNSSKGMTDWTLDDLKGTAKTNVSNRMIQVPFAGKLRADTVKETIAASLVGELDRSPFAIQLQSVGFNKSGVSASVALDRLVLDDWLVDGEKAKVALDTSSLISTAYAKTDNGLSVLNALDANVAVKLGQVKFKELIVSPVSTDIVLQKGKLSLQNMKAQTCGGDLTGVVSLDSNARWNVKLATQKLDTQCLAKGLSISPMLEGVVKAQINVAGTGIEPVAMKKTASGAITADVQNAVLKGISLEKVASAVRAKDWTGLIMSPEDKTELSMLGMKANIKNGELCVTNVTGKSSVAEVSGNAKVGLLTDKLSGMVKAKLGTSVDGRRVTVPIVLGGTVSEPTYQLDVGGALKSQLQEELKNPDLLLKGLNKLLKR